MIGYSFAASPLVPTRSGRDGWRWHRLTDLARLATGHTPSRRHAEYWDGEIPWIQLPDIRALDGQTASETSECINELGIENSAAVLLPAATVCLSRTASVGFVTIMGRPMATSQDFVNWVCGPELDPHFLMYLLLANRQAIRNLGSGAVHHTVYFPTVESFSVCAPKVVEQRRIAASLAEQIAVAQVARRVAAERLVAAHDLVDAHLREAFCSERTSLWPSVKLGELTATCSGSTPSRGTREYFGGAVPWVKTGELKDGVIDATEETVTEVALEQCALPRLPVGTLLVAMYGQGQTRGRTGLLACEATTNQACFAILPRPSMFSSEYLQLWFRANYGRLRALTEYRGGNQPNLNGVLLRQLAVPLPPLPMQQQIAAELTGRLAANQSLTTAVRAEFNAVAAIAPALLRTVFE